MSAQDRRPMEQQRAWDALSTVQNHPKVHQWLAETDQLTRSLPTQKWAQKRRWRWAAAASVVLALALGLAGYLHLAPSRYETGVGEQRDITLADGSRVTLNTDTSVEIQYSRGRRYIELKRGEALFAVKRDATRPFDVAAGDTLTRALGTEFNVDLRSSKVIVSVLEGAVRVTPKDISSAAPALQERLRSNGGSAAIALATLSKGQALEFRSKDLRVREAKADLRRIDAWRARRLEFSDMPLTDAVEEFNRYSTTRVVIGTPDLESVRVSGVFRIGDAEGFLYSLREALNLKTHESTGEVVLIRGSL